MEKQNTDQTPPGVPKSRTEALFEVGERVRSAGVQTGRVLGVSFRDESFHYMVKWDNGPITPHAEGELRHDALPTRYP